jgi:hypothetical protein
MTLLATRLSAQSTFGALVGTATDPTGAVIPNAIVTATHLATNTSRSVSTDASGNYELPNLLPGAYDVSVKAPGFEGFVQRNVPLDPRATVRVDALLQVGTTQTTVEVKGLVPVITTETAMVGDLEGAQQIRQLPINTRALTTSPLTIITTLPGIQVDSGGVLGSDANGAAGISLAGSRPSQSEFSVDGFSTSSVRNNGATPDMYPSTDGISELKVTTELAPAEYGQMGDVSFISKSGTNQFHGSLFEYLQNDALDAIPAFANGKPRKRANDFGGSIGGPIRKDHTFFFFDWESNRQHSAAALTQNVPTAAMLNGDFSALLPGTQLVNPFTGQPYQNNQIATTDFTQTSLNILKTFYPAANFPNAGPLDTTNDYRANFPAPVTANLFDLRIDHNITRKQAIFGRISWKKLTANYPIGLLAGNQQASTQPKAYVVSYNYSILSNVLNELRFGYNQELTLISYPKFPDGATLVTQTLGFKQLASPFPKGSAIPGLYFGGNSGITSISGAREERNPQGKYQIADNLTWIRGRHTMKFGLDIRDLQNGDYSNFTGADNFGNFYFQGGFTGSDFADFALGLPSYTQVVAAGPDYRARARAYGFFGQDSFKPTSRLTINFGVRYEYHPPFHDETLQFTNFDPATGGAVVPNQASLALATQAFLQSINACGLPTPIPTSYGLYPCTPVVTAQQAGIPESLRFGDKTKVLPRLGLAYRVSAKTVVRAGGGLYDEALLGGIFNALTAIHTSNYQAFYNSFTDDVPKIQFPNTESNTPTTGVSYAGNAGFGTATDFHLRDPYGEQWNLTVERDLGRQTGLRVTYNGLRTVGFIISPDLNEIQPQTTVYDPTEKPYPEWSTVETLTNGGSQIYNGLETVVTHRFSAGVFVQSSWVWAKNLSDAEGDAPGGFLGDYGTRIMNHFDVPANYGNVAFTRRHRWLTTAVIDIPVGRGMKYGSSMNRVLDGIVGGWRTSNIIILQTGPYLTPYYAGSADPSGTNAPGRQGSQRPDRLPISACSGLDPSEGQVFGDSCFYYGWPGPIGRFGNSGVGILTGPGTALWNFGLSKNFRLTEGLKLRFESTFTNFLNHVNLATPNMAANSVSFGSINSVQNAEGASARTIQFALRLDF